MHVFLSNFCCRTSTRHLSSAAAPFPAAQGCKLLGMSPQTQQPRDEALVYTGMTINAVGQLEDLRSL